MIRSDILVIFVLYKQIIMKKKKGNFKTGGKWSFGFLSQLKMLFSVVKGSVIARSSILTFNWNVKYLRPAVRRVASYGAASNWIPCPSATYRIRNLHTLNKRRYVYQFMRWCTGAFFCYLLQYPGRVSNILKEILWSICQNVSGNINLKISVFKGKL